MRTSDISPDSAFSIAVILNAGSGVGTAEAASQLIEPLFAEAGIRAEITLAHNGDELQAALERAVASGVSAVVAGGGDGTVNTVANALVGRSIALGVLPLGTLNHFARDVGVPTDMAEAARVIIAGYTTAVDVGEVNGRCFLNNSSVGLYPRIVQLRERYRARGLEKWIVATWATWRVTRVQRPLRMQIEVKGRDVVRSTPLIFVGNNPYRMAGFDAGSRESLTGGRLALYVVAQAGRWNLVRLVWRILVGTAQESGALEMATAETAQVDLPFDQAVTSVAVAIDGEVTTLDLPLRYAIRPAALSVIVPAPT